MGEFGLSLRKKLKPNHDIQVIACTMSDVVSVFSWLLNSQECLNCLVGGEYSDMLYLLTIFFLDSFKKRI